MLEDMFDSSYDISATYVPKFLEEKSLETFGTRLFI